MGSTLRRMGAAALAAGALFLATARCASSDPGGSDGCVPLNGACGPASCCARSSAGDPLTCDADAGACAIQCLLANHDCTNAPGSCCPGYACQFDGFGYGTCK